MCDISITDKDNLKAFLDGVEEPRRKQAAVFIAARAALCVAPVLHGIFDVEYNKKPLTPLIVFRSLLISTVAATMPTDDIQLAPEVKNIAEAALAATAAAYAVTWWATQQDAVFWLDHADAETGRLSIDIAPLWNGKNPLDEVWRALHASYAQ